MSPAAEGQHSPRIIALMNQKGGVGKTTTTASLAAAFSNAGYRVLVVDMDPQGHLGLHMGLTPEQLEEQANLYDLLVDDQTPVEQTLVCAAEPGSGSARVSGNGSGAGSVGGVWVVPSDMNLAGVESELAGQMTTGWAQRRLLTRLAPLREQGVPHEGRHYPLDFILIDCPPSLGLLTVNALAFAREVVVPMQTHFLALEGLGRLFKTVFLVSQSFNPSLMVAGVVLCMHESQTLLASEVVSDLRAYLESSRSLDMPWSEAVVFEPPIRRNIRLAECPSFGQTIFEYAPQSNGAEDYAKLAESIAGHRSHLTRVVPYDLAQADSLVGEIPDLREDAGRPPRRRRRPAASRPDDEAGPQEESA